MKGHRPARLPQEAEIRKSCPPAAGLLLKQKRMCFHNSGSHLQTSVNSNETKASPIQRNSHFLCSFSDANLLPLPRFLLFFSPRVRLRGWGLVRGSYQRMSFDTEINAGESSAQTHNGPMCFSDSPSKTNCFIWGKRLCSAVIFFLTRAACIPSWL